MSKIRIFNVVLILGLLTFPLTGSVFAEDILPTKVEKSIEPNENFEKKNSSAMDKQKAKKESKVDEQKTKMKSYH